MYTRRRPSWHGASLNFIRLLVRFDSPFFQFLDIFSVLNMRMGVIVAVEFVFVMVVMVIVVAWNWYRDWNVVMMMRYLK